MEKMTYSVFTQRALKKKNLGVAEEKHGLGSSVWTYCREVKEAICLQECAQVTPGSPPGVAQAVIGTRFCSRVQRGIGEHAFSN